MPFMDSLSTTSPIEMFDRYKTGDTSAMDSLTRQAQERLDHFARRLLAAFPGIRAKEEVADVLQGAILRLTRTLQQETPKSVREFFGLAAVQIRRELLDLAHSHARQPTKALTGDPSDHANVATDLDRWTLLHETVGTLPADLREVFTYAFYNGWTQSQIAEVLNLSERHVRRLWIEACKWLKTAVGELPSG
jgi:RNA polymerase sigma factor (sigma-70 family)